ncbi:MAG: tetratricopeptide repeat protein [Pirellulales bacterium]|nr:tetratricopeptide repeat protein [Pirellulales bacterium]
MENGIAARAEGLLRRRRVLRVGAVVAAMSLATGFGVAGLDNQIFWDDEANTAIYARNLLKFHRLTAWDGTNLLGYSYGGSLGDDLGKELRVPALPAYVAALGMLFCGETTFGGRIPFVLTGVAGVGLLALWLRRFLGRRFPWYLPPLILALSPAYLLFIRNCRYYALGVTLTVLVWMFWTPETTRALVPRSRRLDGRLLCRFAGAATAVLLLLSTHYLNAAAALVTLPLFFFDRRYRQPTQYVLLGWIALVTVSYGLHTWIAANPFSADYLVKDAFYDSGTEVPYWPHARDNFLWYFRDLGTHEFVPWCLVPVLIVPWLPLPQKSKRLRRLRPIARRGVILVTVILGYVAVAALLTPADMGGGPTAEMRYVVPLMAVGAALGALGVVILWRWARTLGAAALLILLATNLFHLGFLADRADETNPSWPPIWYRYWCEVFDDYQTGNKAMIAFLKELPAGTTVRIWPPYLAYPAMFYVPQLHYCDQLTEAKPVRPDLLKQLPDYLFVERARPEVLVVAVPHLRQKLGELLFLRGADSYELKRPIAPYWGYTWKPELPIHDFAAPPDDWSRFPGLIVAAATDSPVADHPAMVPDLSDADVRCQMADACWRMGEVAAAERHLKAALRINFDHCLAHFYLGMLLAEREETARAVGHLRKAVELNPNHVATRLQLGEALTKLGRPEEARLQYLDLLELKPHSAVAHYNLGNVLLRIPGQLDQAVRHYEQALRIDPKYLKAHVNLAYALTRQGKYDQAVKHCRSVLRIWPNMVRARIVLALALSGRGQKQQAVAELRAALEIVPDDATAAVEEIRRMLREIGG